MFSRKSSRKAREGFGSRRRSRELTLEPLETRTLLSVSPTMIDLGSSSGSEPGNFVEIGDLVYFAATDDEHGRELWVSDGTEAGTTLVADICDGSDSSDPTDLVEFNGELFFVADDGENGAELWKTDGTESGTVMVVDLAPGEEYQTYYGYVANESNPDNLTVSNGKLFFSAADPTYGTELWVSDGTESGTVLVKDIYEGSSVTASSSPRYLVDVDGTLFFSANDGTNGRELWKSDGTESGTVMVKDISPGSYSGYGYYYYYGQYPNASNPAQLTVMDGELYFVAENDTYGAELWKSDGTESGTVLVKDIASGSESSMYAGSAMLAVNGILFFAANDGTNGEELWISDGTSDGTELLMDINPGSEGNLSYYGGFTALGDTLFFSASDGTNGRELWKSDGTEEGTVLVCDVNPGDDSYGDPENSYPFYMEEVDGVLYFSGANASTGRELWKTDGTEEGTVLVYDTISGTEGIYPNSLTTVNGYLMFSAYNNDVRELWTLDPDSAGLDSASLTIYVDSEAVTLPGNIGVEDDGETAAIYTLDGAGTLGLTSAGSSTLGEFFETWRTDAGLADENSDATFSATELLGNTADTSSTVQMFVNGEICTEYADYAVEDGDEIVLIYGSNPVVSLVTNFGAIVLELYEDATPGTVDNFLDYVNDGDYLSSFFHRSAEDFVIQGGGYTTTSTTFTSVSQFSEITSNGTIENEPGISNLRGTVAMAKLSGDADSATSQFFVNLSDDNTFLDTEDYDEFTVFAQVLDMTTVDTIAGLPIDSSNSSPFGELPLSSSNELAVIESIEGFGKVSGVKFLDEDADGVWDDGESLLSGITVYVDANDNGVLDSGETSTTTDENGEYLLQVEAGTYTIRAEVSDGYIGTLTAGSSSSATVEIGRLTSDVDFGETELDAPDSISLLAVSDTGIADDDGLTQLNNSDSSSTLQFLVDGVLDGAEVSVYADGVLIGSATASDGSVTVVTDGSTSLADGARSLTATQTYSGSESDASDAITVTIDTTAPAGLDELPTDYPQVYVLYEFDADSAEEGDEGIQYSLVDAPSGMTIDADTGEISWTPGLDQAVPQEFSIVITDGAGNTVSEVVSLTVLGVIPAYPDEYSVDEDDTLTVDTASGVLANDGDDESGDLSAELVDEPSNGSVSLSTDGSFVYTPDENFYGTDTFTYQASDGSDDTNVALVTITVNNVNDAPIATADSYTTQEDVTLTISAAAGVLANDSDADGDDMTASLVSQASNGTVSLSDDGSFTYTPNSEFSGTDSFTYLVTDGVNESETVTVSLTIEEVADPPTAVADAYTVSEDSTLTITAASGLLANDTDPDSDTLTATVVSSPSNGTLSLNTNGSFTYTPDGDFYGTDSFTYVTSDGTNTSSSATVTITVNNTADAPAASNDSSTASSDGSSVTIDVLANDSSDPDPDDTLTITSVTQGSSGGTVAIDGDEIVYTATYGFVGTETFTYTIEDGDGLTDTATVTMTVTADAADSSGTSSLSGYAYIDRDGDGVRDSDEMGIPGVQVTLTGTDTAGNAVNLTVLTQGDGSYVFDGLAAGTYQLTERQPAAFADGEDSTTVPDATEGDDQFTDIVLDGETAYTENNFGEAGLMPQCISIGMFLASSKSPEECLLDAVIRAEELAGNTELAEAIRSGDISFEPENTAPVAIADAYSTTEGTALTVSATSGVLANDVDGDGDSLTASLVSSPSNGSLTLNTDGSFTYTPDDDFSGTDSFTYRASDGDLSSNTATATITVESGNTAPVASGDSYSVNEDGTLTVAAGSGVLANDTDADGDTLTATLVSEPANGTLSFDSDGSFTYSPTEGYSGTDSFTYRANDGTENSSVATVTITIETVNEAPEGTSDSYTVDEDSTLTVGASSGVLANDTDGDGDSLTASLVSSPTNGTLTLNSDGSFTYTPTSNYNGTDTFTYVASDGSDSSDDVTVTITVESVNDAPVGTSDSYSVAAGATLSVDASSGVLVNDEDVEGDELTASVYSEPENGTLTLNSDGSLTYIPHSDYSGTDTFTYVANDGEDDSEPTTVSIHVNSPPEAVADSYEVDEDTVLAVDAVFGLLANDTDADGDTLTVSLVDSPSHGTLTLNSDGSFSYTPEADYYGSDSFTYTASDGLNESDTATVTISVADVDDASIVTLPEEFTDSDNVAERTVGDTIEFTVGVEDVDDDTFTFMLDLESSGLPDGAAAPTINSTTGEFEWTPTATGDFEIRVIVITADGEANQESFPIKIVSGD